MIPHDRLPAPPRRDDRRRRAHDHARSRRQAERGERRARRVALLRRGRRRGGGRRSCDRHHGRRTRLLRRPRSVRAAGAAVGAGFGLALACDVRIVAASARMTAGYVRRGLSPDAGVSWLLPRHVGLSRASDILLSGRDVDAVEAERIGLAARIVADAAFVDDVREYASRLAAGPPLAQALTKRLLARSLDTPLDAALRDELVYIKQCFATADVAEAIAAFREKRHPTFRGV